MYYKKIKKKKREKSRKDKWKLGKNNNWWLMNETLEKVQYTPPKYNVYRE